MLVCKSVCVCAYKCVSVHRPIGIKCRDLVCSVFDTSVCPCVCWLAELCSVAEPHPAGDAKAHLSVLHPGEQPGDPGPHSEGMEMCSKKIDATHIYSLTYSLTHTQFCTFSIATPWATFSMLCGDCFPPCWACPVYTRAGS